VQEAASYSGIGERKLREMTDEKTCTFVMWNGSKRLIKRKQLDEYIAKAYSV
jgi:excisionase family DNA binding protein